MRQKRNRQRTIFEVLGKNPGPKEFEQMALVLESNPEILDLAFSDLTKGRRSDTGREGMTAEQVLRCAIVKQSRELTYNDLEFLLADSYSLRSFAKLRQDQFPSTSTLQSNIKSLREETWIAIHQFIISYADEEKLEKGRKLRMDSTVVETDIHAPSDSTLLWDGVRVITRWLFEGKEFSPQPAYRFSDHRRVMKKRLLKIQNTRSKTVRESAYWDMLEYAYRVCAYGKEAAEELYEYKGDKDPFDMFRARDLADRIARAVILLNKVIDQTNRRVLKNEKVPEVPRRSGVPMPLSSRVAVPEGGKLAGMRTIVVSTPWSSITCQNGVPFRSDSICPPATGKVYLPKSRLRSISSASLVDR